ncbi:MAG TPA: histidine kinase dimerization/phospho-acceptor domain-containing protein, partial [Candidatus Woesebacteria bacterium]|nr:histidine kinase dimerization/phospho-acceptor domain-containing protein [Candidatus Woesebacteria bacterium]
MKNVPSTSNIFEMPTDRQDILEQLQEDFLMATSHELKTPLTSQKAFIQILDQLATQNNDQQYKRYIKKISDQNEKLSQLVNSLLDASKIKGG